MQIRKLILSITAATLLGAGGGGALADPPWQNNQNNQHNDRDRHNDRNNMHGDMRMGGNMQAQHDRYWRQEYGQRRYVDRNRVFIELRRHNFTRFVGDPYWFQGRFVVKTYDRWGRVVFVEVNPYTGAFIGVVRL